MPLSLPLVDTAATVIVCPVPPVVAAMVAPCPDPPVCPDMVGGIRVSVFGPEVAMITGALGATGMADALVDATGMADALVDATGSVDATGAISVGIAMPFLAASSIWGRMGVCGVNGFAPWSVAMW